MRIRRTFPIVLAVVIVAAAVILAVQLRKQAPPECARLLPAGDAFLYANFGWARKTQQRGLAAPGAPRSRVRALYPGNRVRLRARPGSRGVCSSLPAELAGRRNWRQCAGAALFRSVPRPRFDGTKCAAYLKHTAKSIENYRSVDIYSIPLDGRTVRIAILGVDIAAASNHDDPNVIRGIVDRSRRLASPFGGPAFLRRYYRRVQLASPVWLIARVEPKAPVFEGWSTIFSHPANVVISASFNPLHLPLRTGVLHLRAEASTDNKEDAQAIADKLGVFLSMFHSAEESVGSPGSDADLKVLFDSLKVRQDDNRAVVVATVPTGVFRKLVDSSGANGAPGIPEAPRHFGHSRSSEKTSQALAAVSLQLNALPRV